MSSIAAHINAININSDIFCYLMEVKNEKTNLKVVKNIHNHKTVCIMSK